ncbi:hypothetical protein Tco_1219790, partial [Tanacetum coccineum]
VNESHSLSGLNTGWAHALVVMLRSLREHPSDFIHYEDGNPVEPTSNKLMVGSSDPHGFRRLVNWWWKTHLSRSFEVLQLKQNFKKDANVMLFRRDAKVYYDTTTGVSGHYSETNSALSAQIKVLGKQITYISQNLQHHSGPGHPNTVEYTYFDKSDEDEPSEADKSEIDPLIRESSDTFSMGDEKIVLYPLEDSDELVPIPRVSKKP